MAYEQSLKMPRFSILIPTYNRNALLREALEGLCRQETSDIEVIVLDDASDPPAKLIVDEFPELCIQYRRFEKNVHITEMHESALDALCGDIIYILEDDNGLIPGALQQVDALFREHPDIKMLGTGFVLYNHTTRALDAMSGKRLFSHQLEVFDSREYMLKNLSSCGIGRVNQYRQPPVNHVSATFVSGNFIKDYRAANGAIFMKPAGDYRLKFHLAAGRFYYFDAPLAYVGTHPGQATNITLPNSRRRLQQSSWTRNYDIKHSPLKKGVTFPNISADWVLGDAFETGLLKPSVGLLQASFLRQHINCILSDSPWTWSTLRDLAEVLPHAMVANILHPPILKWLRQVVNLIKSPDKVLRNRLRPKRPTEAWPEGMDALTAAEWVHSNLQSALKRSES
jgi:glycosyltransferase involved in cell wall biosynthesis